MNTKNANRGRPYTHRVIEVSTGYLVGEHTSQEQAVKRVNRMLAMGKNNKIRKTAADFRIEPIVEVAT